MSYEFIEKIDALKHGIEAVTGETYNNLTEAMQELKDGYGQGSGNNNLALFLEGTIEEITIPNEVDKLASGVFGGCSMLKEINVNENHEVYTSVDGILYSEDMKKLVSYPPAKEETEYIMPNSVEEVEGFAFNNTTNLENVKLSDNIKIFPNNFGIENKNAEIELVLNPEILSQGDIYPISSDLINTVTIPEGSTYLSATVFDNMPNIKNLYYNSECELETVGVGTGKTIEEINGIQKLKKLKKIKINGEVKTIPDKFLGGIYGDLPLEILIIGDNVENIGQEAFSSLNNLKELKIGNGVKTIGYSAFGGLNNVEGTLIIPDSVTELGYSIIRDEIYYSTFSGMSKITNVIIGKGLTEIVKEMFFGCSSLTEITIPSNIKMINSSAFNHCDNLTNFIVDEQNENYLSEDGVLFNKDKTILVRYPTGRNITSYTIPSSVTSIADGAFETCETLESIIIPDNVISIGNYAFRYCDNLKNVSIGNGVTNIGDEAFNECNSLESVIIPDNVINMGNSTFVHCNNLESIIIGNGVTNIGKEAFYYCNALKNVTIGNSVTSIDKGAFLACNSLESIIIPNHVTNIGGEAFGYCQNFKSITILNPECVISDDYNTISYNATIYGYANSTAQAWADNHRVKFIVLCPTNHENTTDYEKVEATCTTDGRTAGTQCNDCGEWIIGGEIILASHTDENGDKICDICGEEILDVIESGKCGTNLTYTLYENGKLIIHGTGDIYDDSNYYDDNYYESPFKYRSDITLVEIKEGVTNIGSSTFVGCNALTSVTIPDSVIGIGYYAFDNCTSLTSVIIPDSVAKIESSSFSNCTSLTSVIIGDSVRIIGGSAFSNCTSLTSVIIGNSVAKIEFGAFSNCTSLISIIIPDNVTSIDYNAFYDCTSLKSITIFNPECAIADADNTISYNAIIYGYENSTAQTYANSYGRTFKIYCPHENTTPYEEVPATCTEDGREAGTYCNDCGEWIIGGEIIFSSHTDENGDNICDICGEEISNIIESGKCGNNVNYRIYDNGLTIISGTGNMYDSGYTYNDNYYESPFRYRGDITSVEIKEGVTSIGNSTFTGCNSLTSIIIPKSVTSIGNDAFYDCSSLTSITIPDSVTNIGFNPFGSCPNLTSIIVDEGNENYSSEDGVLFNKDKSVLIQYLMSNNRTSYTIPDNVTSISDYAFRYCSMLTNVTIPNSVTSVGNQAFYNCTSLSSITIPASVTSIGWEAFGACYNLTSIIVDEENENYSSEDGVLFNKDKTTLIQYPVGNSRTSYIIPNSVTSIEYSAFINCSNLTSITVDEGSENYSSDDGILFNKDKTILIKYPASHSATSYIIPSSVTNIGNNAFHDCNNLENVTIPDSVTSIGNGAFYNCNNLKELTILNSDCYFEGGITYWNPTLIICGHENSTAQEYANNNGHTFKIYCPHENTAQYEEVPATCTTEGHTAGLKCNNCGEWVTGEVIPPSHVDEDGDNFCDLCGANLLSDILPGETKTIEIKNNEITYLKFTPLESGIYTFASNSGEDTYGYLFDADKNEIMVNDDYNNTDFSLTNELTAGVTYYWGARYLSWSSGSFDVTLTRNEM